MMQANAGIPTPEWTLISRDASKSINTNSSSVFVATGIRAGRDTNEGRDTR